LEGLGKILRTDFKTDLNQIEGEKKFVADRSAGKYFLSLAQKAIIYIENSGHGRIMSSFKLKVARKFSIKLDKINVKGNFS